MSHNRRMENAKRNDGVTLSHKEAEEYCAYKRQKKISEIMTAMRRSESELTANNSAVKLCERASRLRQNSIRMTPVELIGRGEIFKNSPLKIDCVIGGNGETFAKVKAYEAKCAVKEGAKELTLTLTPSLLDNSRYQEIRKEIRRVRKAVKKTPLKVRVGRAYPQATLSRLARICSELGAAYLSVPYYDGCFQLQTELSKGCLLEVYGVETLSQFKETAGVGMGRIVTSNAWEIYTQWLKEVEEISLEKGEVKPVIAEKTADAIEKPTEKPVEKPAFAALPAPPSEGATIAKPALCAPLSATAAIAVPSARKATPPVAKTDPDMDYQCRIENGELKFS